MSGIPCKHAHSVPATPFARVQLRNFCSRKRPSFLASRRFAKGIPETAANVHRDGPLVFTLIKLGCLAIPLQTSRVFFHISSFTAFSIAFSSFSSISMKRANSLFGNSISHHHCMENIMTLFRQVSRSSLKRMLYG